MKIISRFTAFVLAAALVLTLCSCNGGNTANGSSTVWYLGGKSGLSKNDPQEYFAGVADTVNTEAIYSSLEITEQMLHGVYTLNNKQADIVKVRKEIPVEEFEFSDGVKGLSLLPTAVYFGAENVCSSETRYKNSDMEKSDSDVEFAVLELAESKSVVQLPCTYKVSGDELIFSCIRQTSEGGQPFTYENLGIEFVYKFKLSGIYITLYKNDYSLKLKAYCFTENVESDMLWLSAYAVPASPMVEALDCISSSNISDYAIKNDGSYYKKSACKIDDDGRFTLYLSEKDANSGEIKGHALQYACIVQSSATAFNNMFNVILLDGTNIYYYTDDISEREARQLKGQGVDISTMESSEIQKIAEKKSDLFDALYAEFTAQGIAATINRQNGEINIDASVLFGGDSAVISDSGKALLDKFIVAYTSVAGDEKYSDFIAKTVIEGHTAPVAGSTYESGLPLSTERAENVKNYCLSTVKTAELEAQGMSNTVPIYDLSGQVDMAASRRVSFKIAVKL